MPAQPIPTPSGAIVVVNSDWFAGTTSFFMAMLAAGTPLSYAQGETVNKLIVDIIAIVLSQVGGLIPHTFTGNGTNTYTGVPAGKTVKAVVMGGQVYTPDFFDQTATTITLNQPGQQFTGLVLLLIS